MSKAKVKATDSWPQARDDALNLLTEQYLSDSRAWVIGYSGGKDSTTVVQLAWTMLSQLPMEKRTKPIFVLSADVLVDNPILAEFLTKALTLMQNAAQKSGLPIHPHKVFPDIDETYWVNLIGRGYPAPYSKFRWCSERMKIRPISRFIRDKVAQYGEVVILLGARKAESSSRAHIMNSQKKIGENLVRHHQLPGAWVFTPIESWDIKEVWSYLENDPSPWGTPLADLRALYEGFENVEERPMVMDKSTTAAGRFGCWTCTLVEVDKSLLGLIDRGQNWLRPLNDFRNWLWETHNPARKKEIREHRRRTGRIEFIEREGETKLVWGPFKLEFRKQILTRLLEVQKQARHLKSDLNINLITPQELYKIRQLWQFEEKDWDDSLPRIFFEVTGESLDWLEDDWSGLGGAEKKVLDEVSEESGVPNGLLIELLDIERKLSGMSKRSGIFKEIYEVLRKDWRTYEEATGKAQSAASHN